MAAGFVSAVIRFAWGLGASTHLSDQFPWGCGSGSTSYAVSDSLQAVFVVAASVYIFNLERYRPILSPGHSDCISWLHSCRRRINVRPGKTMECLAPHYYVEPAFGDV